MIKWIAIFSALTAIVLFPQPGRADEWRTSDTWREVGWQILNAVDEQQTEHIARNPDKYEEVGIARKFIGAHPTVEQVQVYFIASAIVHYAQSRLLREYAPNGWSEAFQYFTFGYQYNTVSRNVQVMGGLNIPIK